MHGVQLGVLQQLAICVGGFYRGFEVPMKSIGKWLPFEGYILPFSYRPSFANCIICWSATRG